MTRKSRPFRFTVVASGLDPELDDFEDRFFDAGCDDATIGFSRGMILLDFDREAFSLAHALASAFDDVERAGARVERVEPDVLVSLSDIAERTGLTRAAISLYARGERGKGFPWPAARVSSESPLWDWVAVARWLFRRGQMARNVVVEGRVMAFMNASLARRERVGRPIAAE